VRREPALRTDAALLDSVLARLSRALCDPISGLVDTSDHLVLVLELGELRCDDTEDDVLVLGQVGERLEATGTGCVVFEVVGVDVQVLLMLAARFDAAMSARTWNSFLAMLSYAPSEK
jgi:hypothetical protein